MTAYTTPFDERVLEELTREVNVVARNVHIIVTVLDETYQLPVDIDEWNLDCSETRIPHVRGDFIAAIPDWWFDQQASTDETGWNPEYVRSQVDPREGVRIVGDLGYVYQDGTEDVHEGFDLIVTDFQLVYPASAIQFTVACDEMLVDFAQLPFAIPAATNPPAKNYANLVEMIEGVVLDNTGLNIAIATTLPPITVMPEGMTLTGVKAWAISDVSTTIHQWADAVGAVLWCDQMSRWHLDAAPKIGSAKAMLHGGTLGQIIEYTDRRTLDGFASRVAVSYPDVDADPEPWRIVEDVTAPLVKTDELDRGGWEGSTNSSTGEAVHDPAGDYIAGRMKLRGRSVDMTITAHLWLRVWDTVTAEEPRTDPLQVSGGNTDQVRGLITSLVTRSTGTQTMTTRLETNSPY